jgi:hypothetical protein
VNELQEWEALNADYLATGLAWLHARLDADAGDPLDVERWWENACFAEATIPPALELLGDRLGMSRFERLVLLLVAATEIDPGIAADCARAGDGRPYPTLALALARLPEPAWEIVAPHRPLRYWRLLVLDEPRSEPLTSTRLQIDERILSFLKGLNVIDERLAQLLTPLSGSLPEPLPPSHEQTVERIIAVRSEPPAGEPDPVIELVGIDGAVRRGLAGCAAPRIGLQIYELRPERIPSTQEDLAGLLRLWERETLLLPVALYLDVAHLRLEESTTVVSLIEDLAGMVVIGCREQWPLTRRRIRVIDARRPTSAEQEALWSELLGDRIDARERLAAEFDFNQAVIADMAGQGDSEAALWAACRAQARPRLDAFARRIEPIATWDDLVLPGAELKILHHLVDQVRGRATVLRDWGLSERISRGSAVTALFAGVSGTGKTLAAEVVAHELELDLYKIDLAGIVSKYIGETERNLRRVFDAAEDGGTLLLFDEADALFGKRSEVKDSHDRYANIEVNYLLARIEEFRGVAILATNQKHALDEAFMRRLRFIVRFPFPAPAERAQLWERAFPERAPVVGLDVSRLSRLATSGGMIRNIALNAAFCAAGRQSDVTMAIILEMAQAEFRKLELAVNQADFAIAEPERAEAAVPA